MADMLATIMSYIPHSLMSLLLDDSRSSQEPTRHRLEAAVLFADVSGFTKLTEALAQKGDEGPEEITRLLNQYFSRMIELLESDRGDVVKFSGDALMVLFLADQEPISYALRRAQQAGDAMQELMKELAPVQTSVGPVDLGLKVGIGAGEVQALQVGGVFKRWEYVLTGEGIRLAAGAECLASRGDVVIHPDSATQIHPDALPPEPLLRPDLYADPDVKNIEARLRRYVPGAVRSWMVDTEFHDWLGVLRTMSVLFIGVGGIDYQEDESLNQLHQFLRGAQDTIYRYQGSINKLAVDDKGTIFLVLFGAPPFAHADDPLRAVRCALDLQEVAKTQGLEVRTGVTTGRVFAGPVGSDRRREYTVMGDAVNLAARLMGQAEANTARCDLETHRLTHNQIDYVELEPVTLKGKSDPIPLFYPRQVQEHAVQVGDEHILVGRQEEQTQLHALATEVKAGKSHVILIEAEGGMGKTRLTTEFKKIVEDRGFFTEYGAGDSLEQFNSYYPWRAILAQVFGTFHLDTKAELRNHIQEVVEHLTPQNVQRLPLLNDFLSLDFPENELTSSLSPSLRQQSLESLLLEILLYNKPDAPLCLILENLQWFDSLSWDLLLQLARTLQTVDKSFLLIVTSRPIGTNAQMFQQMQSFKLLPNIHHITLAPLSTEEIAAVVAARLQLPAGTLPQELVHLVHQRAGGNPLFVEEILKFLQQKEMVSVVQDAESQCVLAPNFDNAKSLLPDSLEGLLLARIDQLSPQLQLVMKVAAVLGQSFAYPPLQHALREHTQLVEQTVQDQLVALVEEGLAELDQSEKELSYIFKHLVTQEVTYRTLLHQQRRELHRSVAEWYEATYGEASPNKEEPPQLPPTMYSLLAHHWSSAEDTDKELHYVRLAGEFSASKHAVTEAIQFFQRALELTPESKPEERFFLLLRRIGLDDLQGNRPQQLQALKELDSIAINLPLEQQVESLLQRAKYELETSSLDAVTEYARKALGIAQAIPSPSHIVRAHYLWGASLFKQGNPMEGVPLLQQAIEGAQKIGDAKTEALALYWVTLGIGMQGMYEEALVLAEKASQLCKQEKDRFGEINHQIAKGMIYQHQGKYEEAIDILSAAHQLAQEIGDRIAESMATTALSRAFIESTKYMEALQNLEKNLLLCYQIGSSEHETVTYMIAGHSLLRLGHYSKALTYHQNAVKLSHTAGAQHVVGFCHTALAESLYWTGNAEESLQEVEKAATIGEEQNMPNILSDVLLLRAYLAEEKQEYQEALGYYQQGAAVYTFLKIMNRAHDCRAGEARTHLAIKQPKEALAIVEELLGYLDEGKTLGMFELFWSYLTCIEVLEANQDSRASDILHTAHNKLMTLADTIDDENYRQSYLQEIPHHREIVRRYTEIKQA